MDISAIATAVVAALVPYLSKAGEELAKEAGKSAAERLNSLYESLRKRLQKPSPAAAALDDLAETPQDKDAQAALRLQLRKQMQDDPSLAEALQTHLENIRQDEQTTTFLTQVYGGEVGKIINIGQARDVRID
jgi:hypothetical protein